MIIEQPKLRPPFITLFSEPGMGKTTLACMFPRAIILRVEDGVESVPLEHQPALMPIIRSIVDLEQQIDWVVANRKEHRRKTLILDSVTQAESMFEKHIVDTDPNVPLSINQACGGFGAGVKAVGKIHMRIRDKLERANRAGIAVIVLAHATTDTVEPPDGENYSRYTLRLGKHSQSPWVDNVDMVGFICLQKFVRGAREDKNVSKAGKATSDGTRQIVCHATAGNVSKNRFGIEDAIELPPVKDWKNPLLALIPYYRQALGLGAPVEQVKPDPEPTPEPEPEPEKVSEEEDFDAPESPDEYQEPEL